MRSSMLAITRRTGGKRTAANAAGPSTQRGAGTSQTLDTIDPRAECSGDERMYDVDPGDHDAGAASGHHSTADTDANLPAVQPAVPRVPPTMSNPPTRLINATCALYLRASGTPDVVPSTLAPGRSQFIALPTASAVSHAHQRAGLPDHDQYDSDFCEEGTDIALGSKSDADNNGAVFEWEDKDAMQYAVV